ncbi:hypothetical protein HCN44_010174 [Aphidius gifuensis]|uniref:Uncharacterized protein n=1 Tax=Aphidius gifuensis TaxID=684658 RepID=A0A834XYM8_APHGI|nr:hypothetical protein HCN44_010174 [Aphidius gifuensis]
MNFDENNKLKTVTHVKDIFDGAQSITSDWTTGKIYWTVSSNKQFSIKVIDESFEKLEYIIQPNNKTYMGKLRVYPKQDELFFLSDDKLWYTSNSLNSNASLLFESGKEFQKIDDFTIDYATDKLYLIESFEGHSILKHIDIGTSGRPLNVNDIDEIGRIPFSGHNLVAFNNKIYWTLFKDRVSILYFKNNNEPAVEITNLSGNSRLSFVSSSCPCGYN